MLTLSYLHQTLLSFGGVIGFDSQGYSGHLRADFIASNAMIAGLVS